MGSLVQVVEPLQTVMSEAKGISQTDPLSSNVLMKNL